MILPMKLLPPLQQRHLVTPAPRGLQRPLFFQTRPSESGPSNVRPGKASSLLFDVWINIAHPPLVLSRMCETSSDLKSVNGIFQHVHALGKSLVPHNKLARYSHVVLIFKLTVEWKFAVLYVLRNL